MSAFKTAIKAFNKLYSLPENEKPCLIYEKPHDLNVRLDKFHATLVDELAEVEDLHVQVARAHRAASYSTENVKLLAMIADWLGDIQVYCASEMAKFGLDNDEVLRIIMASNMSKLGPDGKPIYDERGKVLKGPGYWKPEPALEAYITSALAGEFAPLDGLQPESAGSGIAELTNSDNPTA